MTYLQILSYARKGVRAEQDHIREMQEKAIEGSGRYSGAKIISQGLQEEIDKLDVELAVLDELEEIHNRR